MIVHEEKPEDVATIDAVTRAAFDQADEANLVKALRTSGDSVISLVAEEDGAVLGHVLMSKLVAPAQCLALAPVSVAPEHQGRGIGSALVREALRQATKQGWHVAFVLGDPDYYTRFGFSVSRAARFETPYPKSHFMLLELTPDMVGKVSVQVIYAAPFQNLD